MGATDRPSPLRPADLPQIPKQILKDSCRSILGPRRSLLVWAILQSLLLCYCHLRSQAHAEPLLKSGQTVAFLGDSITQFGAAATGGYVKLVESGAAANGIDLKILPAGVSGHKSNQMLERLDRDVISRNPQWMTLSCGINDVWQGEKGVSLEDFQRNITEILDRCARAGVQVLILTATQINLPLDNPHNQKLASYNDFLRKAATQRQLPIADLNAAMAAEQEAIRAAGLQWNLTTDGIHMNHHGNVMMALGVLRGFGFDESQLAIAQKKWRSLPDLVPVTATLKLSLPDMELLEAAAAAKKQSAENLIGEQFRNALRAIICERPPSKTPSPASTTAPSSPNPPPPPTPGK
jgi:lysophospholipase L1-like esterase